MNDLQKKLSVLHYESVQMILHSGKYDNTQTMWRSKVTGGWLLLYRDSVCFFPDPNYEWNLADDRTWPIRHSPSPSTTSSFSTSESGSESTSPSASEE